MHPTHKKLYPNSINSLIESIKFKSEKDYNIEGNCNQINQYLFNFAIDFAIIVVGAISATKVIKYVVFVIEIGFYIFLCFLKNVFQSHFCE